MPLPTWYEFLAWFAGAGLIFSSNGLLTLWATHRSWYWFLRVLPCMAYLGLWAMVPTPGLVLMLAFQTATSLALFPSLTLCGLGYRLDQRAARLGRQLGRKERRKKIGQINRREIRMAIRRIPWQFSLRGLLLVTALVAMASVIAAPLYRAITYPVLEVSHARLDVGPWVGVDVLLPSNLTTEGSFVGTWGMYIAVFSFLIAAGVLPDQRWQDRVIYSFWSIIGLGLTLPLFVWLLLAKGAGWSSAFAPIRRKYATERSNKSPTVLRGLSRGGLIVFSLVYLVSLGWIWHALVTAAPFDPPEEPVPNGYQELCRAVEALAEANIPEIQSASSEELRAFVADQEEIYDMLGRGLTWDSQIPLTRNSGGTYVRHASMSGGQACSLLYQAMAAQARLAVLDGRIDTALKFYLDLARAGRAIAQGGDCHDRVRGRGIEKAAHRNLLTMVDDLSAAQCRHVANTIRAQAASWEPVADTLLRERFYHFLSIPPTSWGLPSSRFTRGKFAVAPDDPLAEVEQRVGHVRNSLLDELTRQAK